VSFWSLTFPVRFVSTMMLTGSGTPIA